MGERKKERKYTKNKKEEILTLWKCVCVFVNVLSTAP